jgi:hypothetical protein
MGGGGGRINDVDNRGNNSDSFYDNDDFEDDYSGDDGFSDGDVFDDAIVKVMLLLLMM